MIRIDIASLKGGVNRLEFEPPAEELELDPEVFSNVQVRAEVDVRADQILVRFDADARARLVCDRTLKPFTQDVSGSYAVLFSSRDDMGMDGVDDVRTYAASDRTIDISEPVRDTLILALPTKRIAPGADDVEIPNRFGEADEEEIDPRWEALRGLRK
ncbi:MAG: DUF177 domain-containing protein [Rhodothermia bacterium]|nr:DUF177 domain-containing protein [Rhodothermia bacterium]